MHFWNIFGPYSFLAVFHLVTHCHDHLVKIWKWWKCENGENALFVLFPRCGVKYEKIVSTNKELLMLSSITLYCQVAMNVMLWALFDQCLTENIKIFVRSSLNMFCLSSVVTQCIAMSDLKLTCSAKFFLQAREVVSRSFLSFTFNINSSYSHVSQIVHIDLFLCVNIWKRYLPLPMTT